MRTFRRKFALLVKKIRSAMTTAVFGTYEDGQVTLDETLPVGTGKAKVVVTVVEELGEKSAKPERIPGLMKGSFWMSEDFNDPIDDLKDYM